MTDRRRGFTLVELTVYLGLVSTALVVMGGIEVSAHRAAALEGALIDVQGQAASYLDALRGDVTAAVDVAVDVARPGGGLTVTLPGGRTVHYGRGERVVDDGRGGTFRREYPLMTELVVRVEPWGAGRPERAVRAAVTFETRYGLDDVLRRTYQRTAIARGGAGG